MSKKTSTLKIIPRRPGTLSPARVSIVDSFLAGRSPRTTLAYRQDLGDFTRYIGAESPEEAVRLLLSHGRGPANESAYGYRADLLSRGLAPATVNRRLAALRSVVKLSRLFGLTDFSLDVEGVKSQPYRDTTGPALEQVRRLLGQLATRKDPKGLRDYALARLLYDLALRRGEAVGLDLADVNFKDGTICVLAKGRREKERLFLPEPTGTAIAAWVEVRGTEPGPLFMNLDRAKKGSRLTGRSVARVLAAAAKALNMAVRPHGLRHSSITEALTLTNGNVRSVQKFSRHRDLRVLLRYDDNRQNLAAEVARLVAGGV